MKINFIITVIIAAASLGCAAIPQASKHNVINKFPTATRKSVYHLRVAQSVTINSVPKLYSGDKLNDKLIASWRLSQKNIKAKIEKCVKYSFIINSKSLPCWGGITRKFVKYQRVFNYDYMNIKNNYFSKNRILLMNNASLMSDFYGEAKKVSRYCETSSINKCQKRFKGSDLGYIKNEIKK
jgi:hypothetical protein